MEINVFYNTPNFNETFLDELNCYSFLNKYIENKANLSECE